MSQPDLAKFRWLVLAVFVLSTAINYLDRMSMATLAPLVRSEFHWSHADYGWIVAAFNLTYAASAPFAGMMVDRLGLNLAASLAVGLWSCAGIATGLTRGLTGLASCRSVLGMAEAAGIPAAGKAIHQYLRPAERALGNGLNQAGVSLGLVLAPPVATWLAVRWGWRQAFVVTGALGLLWIPLWNWTARLAGPPAVQKPEHGGVVILRDRRLWVFVLANALSMVTYSLWTNWTTLYLVDVHRLTIAEAAWYAWIPPLFAALGGTAGGWLSLVWINRGLTPVRGRFRVCLVAAVLSIATAAIPASHSVAWTTAGISLSFLAVAAFSVNMYSLPLDVFGGARSAFAVSMLTCSAGIAGLVSPAIGRIVDLHGYAPVTWIASTVLLAACGVLWISGSVK